MSLTTARSTIERMVDDADGEKYNRDGLNTELDFALTTAQAEVWQSVVNAGSNIFNVETSLTTSSAGVADLTSLRPIKLLNVAVTAAAGQRLTVPPIRIDQAPINNASTWTLMITYVGRCSFPANPGDPFVWGSAGIDVTTLFDTLTCSIAASQLLIKEGIQNPALEQRKTELRAAVQQTLSVPTWSVMPLDQFVRSRFMSGMYYILTSVDHLQLVYL
jgi:hypothetical protein